MLRTPLSVCWMTGIQAGRRSLRPRIAFPNARSMTFALLRLHSEEPLMTLGILSPVTTLPERRIPEFLNDLCSSPPCPVEVFINVHHIDEKTLCGLAEFSRILIARAGETHHYHIVAKHHGRVLDFPTRISIGG